VWCGAPFDALARCTGGGRNNRYPQTIDRTSTYAMSLNRLRGFCPLLFPPIKKM